MYGIYANIWGIWMVKCYHIAYMDPMGMCIIVYTYAPKQKK